ncbi:hypothetical protein Acr_17g0000470 [Actinidia rufa]|uniref:Uncharacterized protein n=1 Tax=Actinidia rufa TaxID=165716 RepID=A0A7J0G0M1_9ERIC|nr:hypothetical protein Acr_17g0000470 [Actinidia rufa]
MERSLGRYDVPTHLCTSFLIMFAFEHFPRNLATVIDQGVESKQEGSKGKGKDPQKGQVIAKGQVQGQGILLDVEAEGSAEFLPGGVMRVSMVLHTKSAEGGIESTGVAQFPLESALLRGFQECLVQLGGTSVTPQSGFAHGSVGNPLVCIREEDGVDKVIDPEKIFPIQTFPVHVANITGHAVADIGQLIFDCQMGGKDCGSPATTYFGKRKWIVRSMLVVPLGISILALLSKAMRHNANNHATLLGKLSSLPPVHMLLDPVEGTARRSIQVLLFGLVPDHGQGIPLCPEHCSASST